MYCPSCGSEERQPSQYCRACGTDLRAVRIGLERPDAITASAVTAREQIGRAMADKIRETETAEALHIVAHEVLPRMEEFLESPEEKRLRRIRTGVVTASIGLGATMLLLLLSLAERDFFPFIGVGLAAFFIGLGILINGWLFTLPRRKFLDRSDDARAQRELDSEMRSTAALNHAGAEISTNEPPTSDRLGQAPSVTEHTTHQLKPNRY